MASKQDGVHFVVVLNRGIKFVFWEFFVLLKQRRQGFKPLAAHLYPIIDRVSPAWR